MKRQLQPSSDGAIQVKALEAADAARRKEAAKNADRIKQKGTLDKQRAERAKVPQMPIFCAVKRIVAPEVT